MNQEKIVELEEQVKSMEQEISNLKAMVASSSIDKQNTLKSNPKIQPGVASKVAFDANGLILKGEQLQPSDIPSLQINKIIGLQQALDNKTSSSEVTQMIDSLKQNINKSSRAAVSTGIKVNYDENGRIISSSGLIQDDIPTLSLDKITGLKERLDLLERYHQDVISDNDKQPVSHSDNSALSNRTMTIDDIPNELIVRLNEIESKLTDLVSSTSFNAVAKSVEDKLDANTAPISAGTFTKVKVDSKGLITEGSSLTTKDLPELNINDINNLRETLSKKIDDTIFFELSNNVSTLISSMNRIGEVVKIRESIETKASDADLKTLTMRVDKLERLFSEIISKIPGELILSQLDSLSTEISNISGRLSVLETRLNIV